MDLWTIQFSLLKLSRYDLQVEVSVFSGEP